MVSGHPSLANHADLSVAPGASTKLTTPLPRLRTGAAASETIDVQRPGKLSVNRALEISHKDAFGLSAINSPATLGPSAALSGRIRPSRPTLVFNCGASAVEHQRRTAPRSWRKGLSTMRSPGHTPNLQIVVRHGGEIAIRALLA